MGAVRDARVIRPDSVLAQPAALEEGADDVAPVAHDVDDAGVGVGGEDVVDEVRRLGRLFDGAHRPDQTHAPRHAEDPPDSPCGDVSRERHELRARPP